MDSVRIDKWLWAARFFKTRSLATDAVAAAKVKLNDERVKPARSVKVGDVVDVDNGATAWQVVVKALDDVRRSAVLAQTLYEETPESVARRETLQEQRKYFHEPGLDLRGRPTKRDRRLLDKSR
ncbi:MAG: hslR [Herminiimonas sp.]|nr:hslR [Herminiimonas sp.]